MLLDYLSCIIKEIAALFKPKKPSVKIQLPYYSQWESPNLVDKILSHEIKAENDPKWKNSGAKDPQDYAYWSWNICGMACLKMVLVYKFHEDYPLVKLAKECAHYKGYFPRQNAIDGLFYYPFCMFVKDKFGLNANSLPFLTINRIKFEINRGNFIIVSVNADIRNTNAETPKKKSGHLVLITGYDNNHKNLFLHNPSGFHNRSQENYQISETNFSKFFGHKGIIIYNEKE